MLEVHVRHIQLGPFAWCIPFRDHLFCTRPITQAPQPQRQLVSNAIVAGLDTSSYAAYKRVLPSISLTACSASLACVGGPVLAYRSRVWNWIVEVEPESQGHAGSIIWQRGRLLRRIQKRPCLRACAALYAAAVVRRALT